jgi:hypothetical protein
MILDDVPIPGAIAEDGVTQAAGADARDADGGRREGPVDN